MRHSLRAGAQERAPAALGLLGEERVREQLAGDAGATADVLATRLDDLARPSAGCGGATTSRC